MSRQLEPSLFIRTALLFVLPNSLSKQAMGLDLDRLMFVISLRRDGPRLAGLTGPMVTTGGGGSANLGVGRLFGCDSGHH
jgi:hypothetical protein